VLVTRGLSTLSFALATTLALSHASAQQSPPTPPPTPTPTPTKEELAQAKKAFEEGNALYKANKLAEAVERLKESYRLSRNAFLLYNIGHVYDQMGQKEMTLFYYKKFLSEAPATVQMRPEVEKRVIELEKASAAPAEPEKPEEDVTPEAGKPQLQIEHELIFTVPPGKPIDVAIVKLADASLVATLFYRGAGDEKFTAKKMIARENELVGHIPAKKVFGNSIQYYIEVRDAKDTLVSRSGKATVPHLVNIERGAKEHSYPDLVEDADREVSKPLENPLENQVGFQLGFRPDPEPVDTGPPFNNAKWIATGTGAALFGTAFASFLIARSQHDSLVRDANACGTPPCREFDLEFGHAVEERGKRYEQIYQVTFGLGVAASAVAAYFWYRNLSRKSKAGDTSAWMIAPSVDDTYAGAAAMARF
jgi:hypothetical protein